ncbi:hypothetical protein AB0M36_29600 [Actinoplanes sp. NPDC051346]|uniref:hypothetical protein n=1 Tax=Actinoplanes sp. NPDC051346 TaxID=3155048 RepID=UPI00344850B9
MRDRPADRLLAEIAGFPDDLGLRGPAVPAHLVDLVERGVLTIRPGDEGEIVVALTDQVAAAGEADAELLRVLFPEGYGSEAVLRRFAGKAKVLERAARRRARAAGWWRTEVSVRPLLLASMIPFIGGFLMWLLHTLVRLGAPSWVEGVGSLPVLFATLMATALMVMSAFSRVLTPAGSAAAAEVRAYVAACRNGPVAGFGDLVALGRVREWVAGDHESPVWARPFLVTTPGLTNATATDRAAADRAAVAELTRQISAAFEYAPRGPDIPGGGGGS